MHPDMWYHLNAICHHDGCRLVHPAKWDIGQFRGAFMTDARLVHPIRRFIQYIDAIQDVRNCMIHLHFDLSITFIRFSNITFQFHIHFRILFSRIYSIYVLISYTHSHTHFIYSFMHSFHMLGKLLKILDIR